MSDSQPVYAGIDVSKASLDLALGPDSQVLNFTNDDAGHQSLLKALAAQANQVNLVVLEATGGYEFACAVALQRAGHAVAVINARQAGMFLSGWITHLLEILRMFQEFEETGNACLQLQPRQ